VRSWHRSRHALQRLFVTLSCECERRGVCCFPVAADLPLSHPLAHIHCTGHSAAGAQSGVGGVLAHSQVCLQACNTVCVRLSASCMLPCWLRTRCSVIPPHVSHACVHMCACCPSSLVLACACLCASLCMCILCACA
jgi:hypothetical protein